MISFKIEHGGDFKKLERFLDKMSKDDIFRRLEHYGLEGIEALASATPVNSGLTAESWGCEVQYSKNKCRIIWTNDNVNGEFPIAVMLQYGHGTGTGGYVQGQDYINPAIKPIFDKIAENVWRVVTSA